MRRKTNHLPVLIMAGAAGLAALGVAGAVALTVVLSGGTPPMAISAPKAAPTTLTRDEFRQAVHGRTPVKVKERVGTPDETVEVGETGDRRMWTYYGRTYDPITGKTDDRAVLHFRLGLDGFITVHSISFY